MTAPMSPLSRVVSLTFVLLWSCTDDPPDCPGARTCDILEADCQERARELVSCLRSASEDPPVIVPIIVRTAEEIVASAVERAEREGDPDQDELAFRRALALLGLSSVPQDVASDVRASWRDVSAIYEATEKRITILDRGMPLDSEQSFLTLVHELVHAQQDVEGAFAARARARSLDEWLAARAMTEGEATLVEMRVSLRLDDLRERQVNWDEWIRRFRGDTDERARSSTDLYRDAPMLFPYSYGASYVYRAYERGGWDEVRAATHEATPKSTHAVMLGGLAQAAMAHRWIEDVAALGVVTSNEPWHLSSASHLGAWFLQHLNRGVVVRDFAHVATGDVLSVLALRSEQRTTEVVPVWRVEFPDSVEAARSERHVAGFSGLRASAHGASLWITSARAPMHVPELAWAAQERPDLFFEDVKESQPARVALRERPCAGSRLAIPRPPLR